MIIITGVSGGIGKFIIEKLALESDENIIGIYNNTKPAKVAGNIRFIKADLTKEEEVIKLTESISGEKNLKLIHCAGIAKNGILHKMDYNDWQNVISTNLNSAFLITKHLLPIMREQSFGKIIFLSSIVPQIGVIGTSSYAASKAGLWGLMKTLIKENASKNITCNTLNLGYFNIGMIQDVPDSMLTQIIDSIPVKKLGDPIDIFYAIDFIFKSNYITGSTISINGGLF
jgi:NAD(P)-dependent dehydrogenase (short-subunit alcohol dehydrogenase family)